MASYEQIAEWLRDCDTTIAFTGAGISTESGIPDFRSPGGVWANNRQIYYDEFRASHDARREYWRQKALAHVEFRDSQPNRGHLVLSQWGQAGKLAAVITQNIDGLHQQAGSPCVLELHGTARKVGCLDCDFLEAADPWIAKFEQLGEPPACPACGGPLKHATISFGQSLPQQVLAESLQLAKKAQFCLAIGSSLVVEPAASLPRVVKQTGGKLIIINREPTPLDDLADAVLHEEIGASLGMIADLL